MHMASWNNAIFNKRKVDHPKNSLELFSLFKKPGCRVFISMGVSAGTKHTTASLLSTKGDPRLVTSLFDLPKWWSYAKLVNAVSLRTVSKQAVTIPNLIPLKLFMGAFNGCACSGIMEKLVLYFLVITPFNVQCIRGTFSALLKVLQMHSWSIALLTSSRKRMLLFEEVRDDAFPNASGNLRYFTRLVVRPTAVNRYIQAPTALCYPATRFLLIEYCSNMVVITQSMIFLGTMEIFTGRPFCA